MKLDLFKDKEYDGFDWLNKAVEPILYPLNEKLSQIPMETQFPVGDVIRLAVDNYMSIGIDALIIMAADAVKIDLNSNEVSQIKTCFTVQLEELIFDVNHIPSDKFVRLVKTKASFDEQEIRNIVGDKCFGILNRCSNKYSDIGRMNEVMDILGCTEDRKSRSVSYKAATIGTFYKSILVEDKWRIRDMDLAIKTAEWMKHFIETGNLASMSNFIKLKCMTHSGNPIYSVQETV